MTALSSPNDDLRRFSDVLEDLGDAPGEKLSLEELVAAFGERGFGAMILILSLLALLPWP
ncbi:exopolysaccharide biosynthesis protein, partial [Brevundimonas sp.]